MKRFAASPRHIIATFIALVAAIVTGSCAGSPPLPPIPSGDGAQHIPGKIVWHALITDDIAGARTFYGELFGWTFHPAAKGSPYTTIRSGSRDIGTLVEVRDTKGMKITQWLSFMSVDDVDRSAELTRATGEVLRGPFDVPEFGRVAVVKDAAGAPLVLVHSSKGDPADGVEPAVGTWIWSDYAATDVDAGLEFYRKLVGYEVGDAPGGTGDDYRLLNGAGQARAGIFPAPEHVGANWLPYLRVDDATAAMERAKELGASVLLAPTQEIRNGSTAVIQDPDGAVLVLQHYPF